jgi:hypothetical protein
LESATSLGVQSYLSVSMSSTGQYQTACTSSDNGNYGSIVCSTNFGVTWSLILNLIYTDFISVSISSSGQYQTVVSSCNINSQSFSGLIYTSSSYGQSFSTYSPTLFDVTNGSYSFYSVSVSNSGKYQKALYINTNNASIMKLAYSTNFGLTWNQAGIVNANVTNSLCSASIAQSSDSSITVNCIYGSTIASQTSTNYYTTYSTPIYTSNVQISAGNVNANNVTPTVTNMRNTSVVYKLPDGSTTTFKFTPQLPVSNSFRA